MAAIFHTATPGSSIWVGKWDSKWTDFTGQPFYIGGVYFPNSTSNTDNRRLAGKIYAVRIYKRSLTDAELKQNRIVDEARFFNNPPASNLKVVNTQPEGASATVQCSIEDGNYNLTGSQTVTADTVRINGKRLEPFYLLETYADGGWTQTASGLSHSYSVTGGAAPMRLTWRWQSVGTILSVR